MLTIVVVLSGWIYLRGWFAIRKTRAAQFTLMRLSCFLLGLAVLWIAIASPLDDFADASLSAHMVQHLLLMSAVPPLLLLGWPVVPLLRGLPAWILRPVLGPLLRLRVTPPPWALAHFAAGSLDRNELDLPWLACARGLRFCS